MSKKSMSLRTRGRARTVEIRKQSLVNTVNMEYRRKPTMCWSISSRQCRIGCVCHSTSSSTSSNSGSTPKSRVSPARGIWYFRSLAWPSIPQIRHFADTSGPGDKQQRAKRYDKIVQLGCLQNSWRDFDILKKAGHANHISVTVMPLTASSDSDTLGCTIWTCLSVEKLPVALAAQWLIHHFFFASYHFCQQLRVALKIWKISTPSPGPCRSPNLFFWQLFLWVVGTP